MRTTERITTGLDGLDSITHGGFIPGRSYMLRGAAGSGKTILGFHFLEAGLASGETVLFINLEEDLGDLQANAEALGFDTGGIEFLDLSLGADAFTEDQSYEIFGAEEVEQQPVADRIVEAVTDIQPTRIVVDPLTQLRHLTADDYQFRKQVIGFMRFLKSHGGTVAFTVQNTERMPTEDLQFLTDGVVALERTGQGRRLTVPKFRGSDTQSGTHAFRITDEGIRVFPALVPGDYAQEFTADSLPSGVAGVDDLLKGGPTRGTVSVISGPTGVGKTTLGTQFARAAASRGERSVIYLFEENEETFLSRSAAIDIPVDQMVEQGTLDIVELEPLEHSPQEFASMVREQVETEDTSVVMIDGLAGYRLTLRGRDDDLLQNVHALGRYLQNMGVTTFLIDETQGIAGEVEATNENISYLADSIVFLRHLELDGELRKAIGVLKKRTGDFERQLREFEITSEGIRVGDPLSGVRGILSGNPERVG